MREGAGKTGDGPGRVERYETVAETLVGQKGDGKLERHQAPAPASTEKGKMMESTSDPEFSLAVEVAYHGARQAFCEAMHRWTMFLAIVLGASAVTPFGSEKLLALFAAFTAAADIAFDFTGRAQRHADLRRRYFELAGDVADAADPSDVKFASRWMMISADEPPLYNWLEQVVRRKACIDMERVVPAQLPLWKRMLAQVLRG
jgi:hypothetical protein